ncbi:MAG: nitroreductase family protein [Betaproteobacteria bacterium]|nr:nitroreductase family protein [Betaproteobacteria bacterium]
METLTAILDLARWAPSGDNTQPWRFELVSPREVIAHGFDTRDHVVYDLDGMPSHLAHGALLETMDIAASAYGLRCEVEHLATGDATKPKYRVVLRDAPERPESPLAPFVTKRATQRRPMKIGGLTLALREALEASVCDMGVSILWFDTPAARRSFAKLLYRSAWIRLVTEEAYKVHSSIIEWRTRFSDTKLPEEAVGVDFLTARMMEWAMRDWKRVQFMNRWFGGTLAPRLQLDVLPGLRCAAHCVLLAPEPLDNPIREVEAGRAVQRFWLTLTQQGMWQQPEMTPLIFSRYSEKGLRFTQNPAALLRAREIRDSLVEKIGRDGLGRAFWIGRIGFGAEPRSRSLRLDVDKLLVRTNAI